MRRGIPRQARGAQLLRDERPGRFGGDQQPQPARIRGCRDRGALPRELRERRRETTGWAAAYRRGVIVPVEERGSPVRLGGRGCGVPLGGARGALRVRSRGPIRGGWRGRAAGRGSARPGRRRRAARRTTRARRSTPSGGAKAPSVSATQVANPDAGTSRRVSSAPAASSIAAVTPSSVRPRTIQVARSAQSRRRDRVGSSRRGPSPRWLRHPLVLFSSRGTHSNVTSRPAMSSCARRARTCMSGCLTFQRPVICSTTSFESIRTATAAEASRSNAASSPAISPLYSATLLVAMPT